MAKPVSYSDKLRGDFRRYLIKIVCNKSDQSLTETEILKAFDLAVQKQKLTSLEAELLKPPQLITSKIDVSGDALEKGIYIHQVVETMNVYGEALDRIASWSEGEEVTKDFDEPAAAAVARKALVHGLPTL